ncbi:MAG: alpha/beta hydrolase fold domain-containing protein [Cyanobacteria bacterium J06632_22]
MTKRVLMGRVLTGVWWLLVGVAFFLSLWIVVPPFTLGLLKLTVGAPEISPLLLGGNAIALIVFLVRRQRGRFLGIFLSFLGVLLSTLPLLQLPAAIWQAEQSFEAAIASETFVLPPADAAMTLESPPFSPARFVGGMPTQEVRYKPDIVFAEPDGIPLKLSIYQPLGAGVYPTIISLYGGGWQNGSPADLDRSSRYLASLGYVVAAIDYRHAPDYQFPTQVTDVEAALSFLSARASAYGIDKQRLVLMGWSAGAHLAMLTAYQTTTPIRGVVGYYGPVNLVDGYKNLPSPDPLDVRAVLRTFMGGTPDELPVAYNAASPVYAVKPGLPPTLLVYGRRDHIVKVEFGLRMYEALQKAENTAVFVEIPWAEHAFDAIFRGVSNQLAMKYTERFLRAATVVAEGE